MISDFRIDSQKYKSAKVKMEKITVVSRNATFGPNLSYKSEIGFAKVRLRKAGLVSKSAYKSEILFAKVRSMGRILKGLSTQK
jgi:hypothetical protein